MTEVAAELDYARTATCRACGYPLRDLPEQRCPECGRAFVAHDPRTMHVPSWKPPMEKRPPASFGASVILLAASATVVTVGSSFDENPVLSPYGFVLWLTVAVAWAARTVGVRQARRNVVAFAGAPDGPRWRPVVVTMLLLTLIGGLSYERCPHARYLAWGAIPVAVVGDACGNQRHLRPVISYLWAQ